MNFFALFCESPLLTGDATIFVIFCINPPGFDSFPKIFFQPTLLVPLNKNTNKKSFDPALRISVIVTYIDLLVHHKGILPKIPTKLNNSIYERYLMYIDL